MLSKSKRPTLLLAFSLMTLGTASAQSSHSRGLDGATPIDPPPAAKPIAEPPNTSDLQLRIEEDTNSFVDTISRSAQALSKSKNDIGACYEETKYSEANQSTAQTLRDSAYLECLATAATVTRTTWQQVSRAFKQFGDGLVTFYGQLNEQRTRDAEQVRTIDQQQKAIAAKIKDGRQALFPLQAIRSRGITLDSDQERKVRNLGDDLLTMQIQGELLARRRVTFELRSQRLGRFATQINDLRGELGVLAHQSSNRVEIWTAVLEDVKSYATIPMFDTTLGAVTTNLQTLGPAILSIRNFRVFELPPMPESTEPIAPPPALPRDNIDAFIAKVLDRTK